MGTCQGLLESCFVFVSLCSCVCIIRWVGAVLKPRNLVLAGEGDGGGAPADGAAAAGDGSRGAGAGAGAGAAGVGAEPPTPPVNATCGSVCVFVCELLVCLFVIVSFDHAADT